MNKLAETLWELALNSIEADPEMKWVKKINGREIAIK
jgi:hypothetical protein